MLTEFFSQLNPFNLYGCEVTLEDILCQPLQPGETLVQDCFGRCRRIKASVPGATLKERVRFWVQTHVNDKGHLDAIHHLISTFYRQLQKDPPRDLDKLQKVHEEINQLRSLKNDEGFVSLNLGDPEEIEHQLCLMEREAYRQFAEFLHARAREEEGRRKHSFCQFQTEMESKLHALSRDFNFSTFRARLIQMAPGPLLRKLVWEWLLHMQERITLIEELYEGIDKIEHDHRGKFTIPEIQDQLRTWKQQLRREQLKLWIEKEMLYENLLINYRVTSNNEIEEFIDLIKLAA